MAKKRYLTAFEATDGTVHVMGNDKDLKYAIEVVERHNHFQVNLNMKPVGKWKVFELGKEVKIK